MTRCTRTYSTYETDRANGIYAEDADEDPPPFLLFLQFLFRTLQFLLNPMADTLRINGDRLWSTLMETARFGGTPNGGINRLTLTKEDAEVRAWLKRQTEALGCEVAVDEVGNMFAIRPGKRSGVAPIAMGSHLDTQPTGGKFDGVLGVLSGLEALRTIVESGHETNAPIAVVNWTNEEGSRFSPPMLCSGVYAGVFSREKVDATLDINGIRFGDAIEAIGWRGAERAGSTKLSAYFELHIEQGPILELERQTIGIVTGVQGMRWYEATITGQEAHSGSTPMNYRADSLITAARLILSVQEIAKAHGPAGVGTVGRLQVRPNSSNVIPGEVFLTIDFRHPEDLVLDSMEAALGAAIEGIKKTSKTGVDWKQTWNCPPVVFDKNCVTAVRDAAKMLGYPAREIVSGPGHDAVYVSRVVPTSMIFVPCAGGLSHNEAESITQHDSEAGAQVLLDAVLAIDEAHSE
jgi:beta-ureidopropionase / N-carbamoyl-L-amino-acid hydrolase